MTLIPCPTLPRADTAFMARISLLAALARAAVLKLSA
jgi:hypothetical protein